MLNLGLVINVMVGVFAYKAAVALIEFTCLKLLATLLGKQIQGKCRQERIDNAIKLADEELKKAALN